MKKYQTEIDIAVLWSKIAFLTGWVRITFLYEFLAYLRRTRRNVCQWVKQIVKYKYPNSLSLSAHTLPILNFENQNNYYILSYSRFELQFQAK